MIKNKRTKNERNRKSKKYLLHRTFQMDIGFWPVQVFRWNFIKPEDPWENDEYESKNRQVKEAYMDNQWFYYNSTE